MEKLRTHKIQINDRLSVTTFDTIGTIIIGYMIAEKMEFRPLIFIPGLLASSVIIHNGLNIDTELTKYLDSDIL
jgi:hypothetical protein